QDRITTNSSCVKASPTEGSHSSAFRNHVRMSNGTAALVAPPPLARTSRQRRRISGDRIFRAIAYGAAGLILVIAGIFVIALFIPALPAISRFGLGFFAS